MGGGPGEQGLLWWLFLSVTGLMVGFVSGLFGVGGGFLLTPLLTTLFGVPEPIAVGTGLCQMVGAATAGQIRYARLKQGEVKLGVLMIGGGLVGVSLGAQMVGTLENSGAILLPGGPTPAARLYLTVGYLLLLGGIALWMTYDLLRSRLLRSAGSSVSDATETSRLPGPLARAVFPPHTLLPRAGFRTSVPAAAYVGLLMGGLSGFLGIGGGVILLPLLVYGFGLTMRAASGTGMVMLLATSLWGTVAHARLGHVHLPMALMLLVGSSVGAQMGALWAQRIDGRRLRGLFVALVTLTAALVAANLVRMFLPQ